MATLQHRPAVATYYVDTEGSLIVRHADLLKCHDRLLMAGIC
jgi:hypothetical protein